MTLDDLKPGTSGRIVTVSGDARSRRRIVDMGVTPGTFVEVERVAPLGDPIEVRVRGYRLLVRRSEATQIMVEMDEACR
jgi:Fe2+ transport system protein FeoA